MVWIYQSRSFYYIFYLEWIKQELNRICHEAHEIMNTYESNILKLNDGFIQKFHRNRFKWLRQYYGSTYDLYDAINYIFGWSNTATVLVSVHLILTDSNFIYWKLINKQDPNIIGK